MNLIKLNSTFNVLEINDDAKKQRNSLLLVMGFNLPNLLFNSGKIFEKGFNFSHVFLIIFVVALIKFLLDFKLSTLPISFELKVSSNNSDSSTLYQCNHV